MKTLISSQNPTVKHLAKLVSSKSYRYKSQRIVILGETMVREVSKLWPIRTLLSVQEISIKADETFITTPEIIRKIAPLPEPEPLLAEVDMPPFRDLSKASKILILDGIKDPGNLGTILRTAHALGFNGAHLLDNCVDPFNDKALRAAKSSTFFLPLGTGPIHFEGSLYAAEASGSPIDSLLFEEPFALILGSESHGITTELASRAKSVAIPLSHGVDSLNVGIAAAICMYVMTRKQ
jgi:RNA methyltransferase, TrmH family